MLTPINVEYHERFPVLYLFDGQNIFHSFQSWNGLENPGWRVDDVLDSLNRAGALSKMIVVGIFNSPKRLNEYMPYKPEALVQERIAASTDAWEKAFKEEPLASKEQLQFLVEELKPYIDATFNTRADRAHTFVGGSSMGGLLSAFAICEYPEVFGGAACLSTHWPILDGVFLEYLKEHLPEPTTHKIYFDYGSEGLDASYAPFQQKTDEMMRARGYREGTQWKTVHFPGAKHHEVDWSARLHLPLQFLMGER